MATLRTPLFGQEDLNLSAQRLAEVQTEDMSSLRRDYEAGRIGTDINAAAAQEASLRRAAEQGDAAALAEAETLRANISGLQQRQAMYAPRVGRVEDIGGVGDALSWAAGQVGQGAASMQDPLAVGAALQGAGRILGNGPGILKTVGAGLRGAGYVVPFAMNQRQMTGEAYNAMTQDEALMARTSAAEREQNANLYGAGAGLLDTVVPGMIAGKLTGAGLRQGISQSGLGARTLKGMAMEGATETAQQMGQQGVLGYMNPDRDTSGDFMDNVNAFAGGAFGTGPMVMAGEMADSGYRRVGDTAQKVSAKTGEVVDLLSEKAGPTVAAAKNKLDEIVDLFRGEDGKVTPGGVVGKAKDMYADYEAKSAERDVISGMPPDTVDANDREAYAQWYTANAPKRMQTVADRLGKLADEGDEQAAKIYDGLTSQDEETRMNALEEGANHILNQDEWTQFGLEAERRAKRASRWANKFGKMAGAVGRAAGEAAVDFGKSVVSGAMKKNAQGMRGESLVGVDNIYDPEAIRLRDAAIDKEAENWNQARQRSYNRAKIVSEFLAEELKVAQAMPAVRMPQGSPEAMTGFMKDIGLEIADLAENWHATPNAKGNTAQAAVALPVKGREALAGPTSLLKSPADSKGQQFNGLKLSLNRIARSLKLAYGERAEQVINELQAIDQNSAPELFDYMREELAVQMGPRAARHNAEVEREAQSAVIDAMGQDVEASLLDAGVNVRDEEGRKKLFDMVRAVDDGVAPPVAVRALEGLVGKDRLRAMRATLRPAEASRDDLVDDGGAVLAEGYDYDEDGEAQVSEQTDFDKALGETKREKMGAPRTVGFYGTSKVRTTQGGKADVFARGGKVTAKQIRQFDDEMLQRIADGEEVSLPPNMARPRLIKKDDAFKSGEFAGMPATEGARRRMERAVGVDYSPKAMISALRKDAAAARQAGNRELYDSIVARGKDLVARDATKDPALAEEAREFFAARSEGGKWGVDVVSVKDYLKSEDYSPERKIALYRDYLRQDAVAATDPAARKGFVSVIRKLGPVIADFIDQSSGKNLSLRTAPMDRKQALAAADRYFAERFMVVADQATDATPGQISPGELSSLADAGNKAYDHARIGRKGDDDYDFKVIDKANVIVFKSAQGSNKKGELRIPANQLVGWAKRQMGMYEEGTAEQSHKGEDKARFGDADLNQKYLEALTYGIAAVMDSGVVEKVKDADGKEVTARPFKLNQFGKPEFFTPSQLDVLPGEPGATGPRRFMARLSGLPSSLRLATSTVGGLSQRNAARVEAKAGTAKAEDQFSEANEARKVRDWKDEPFTPDDTPEVDSQFEYRKTKDKETEKTTGGYELKRKGNVAARTDRTGGFRDDGSYEYGPTPSDFGPAPEGFDDVSKRTRALQKSAQQLTRKELGIEDAFNVRDDEVEIRARQITDALIDDYTSGLALIQARLTVARKSKYSGNKYDTVGGAQYAIPVVEALSEANLREFSEDMTGTEQLQALRAEAVAIIDGSSLNKDLKAKYGTPKTTPNQRKAAKENAAEGVGAGLGKPSGVGKVKLTGTSIYLAKDQAKSDRANKFIGRGSATSSTAQYAKDWGDRANTGSYTADDVVFVSAEGNRSGRVPPDLNELNKAMAAGATLITDSATTGRNRPYNVGEREVAAHLTKHGYVESEPGTWTAGTKLYSRTEDIGDGIAGEIMGTSAPAFAAAQQALDAFKRLYNGGMSARDALAHADVINEVAMLSSMRLQGFEHASEAYSAFANRVDQITSLRSDRDTTVAINSRLTHGGATLSDMMKEIIVSDLPEQFKAIARAVKTVAGSVPVELGALNLGGDGEFSLEAGKITMLPNLPGATSVVLHEGVHAATAAAVLKDSELHKALYDLMDHVAKHDGKLVNAYGMKNTLEFLAEGLSNERFQKKLMRVPASKAVEKYLGQTLANAWDAFVGLVRQALGLKAGQENALSQLLELSGRAMRGVKANGVVSSRANTEAAALRQFKSSQEINLAIDTISQHAKVVDYMRRPTQKRLVTEVLNFGDNTHIAGVFLATVKGTLDRGYAVTDGAKMDRLIVAAADAAVGHGMPSKVEDIGTKFNQQNKTAPASTQAERDAAIAEVKKTLGDDIAVRFEQLTGYSGAYLDKEAAIVISMTPAAGTLQTAYHEALHAFVARLVKGNDKAKRVLNTLANHEPTMERVRALLADYPEALKQLTDGEERIAYIYQFWRAGLLDLPETRGSGLLQKLRRFFRGMLGRISDLERSSDLLEAFARGSYAGDVSVAGKVMAKTLAEGTWGAKTMRKMDSFVQRVAALTVPAQSLLLMSDSPTAQKLGNTFWTNPGDEDAGEMREGYLNARERMAKRYTNEFSRIVNGFTERDHKDVIKYLQAEVDPADIAYQPHREAVEKIRALLQRFRKYMVDERGMKIGDRGPLYFPRVWSPHRLTEKKAEFLAMMRTNHPTYDAEAVYNAILKKFEQNTEDSLHGREGEDAVLKPTQNAGNKRILDFITGEQAQPFLEQSLVGALSRYFHEGARAAEYTARFGQTGRKLEKALSMIHAELRAAGKKRREDGELKDQDAETKWVARQMRDVTNAVDAMEGTLGSNISDGWRKTNSWVTVYQNVRLLPMALFSSIVDPLGMMARGATMRDAYDGFLRGMSEVVKNWGEMITGETKERKVDKWERLAMAVGSVDAAVFNHHVSDEYASVFMSAGAKKINDFVFKANGMEAWNRGMRVAATRAAALFIVRHKSLPDVHSERWLAEIGLKASDIHTDANGDLIANKHALAAHLGIDVDDAAKRVDKIHYAINRWVQGAVLTPNAAQRPAWGSDPHYSMFFHLKQFSYSFHQTILKRAVNEMNHGNLAPMGAFAWYIPVMIASDITKGLIQGGGELPAHMKGMDLGDWVAHGAERAGLLGLGQLGVDASGDVASIGGPAVEQIIDAFSDPLERTMIKAAPAHGLYAEAFK